MREPGLGTHLVARVRPEQRRGKVLLAAHLDTVFGPGFAEKHPFHIEGEWAHGLGAGDCKSGVLISLFGALILKKAGLLPPWELTYLFTCDEETGSRSGRKVYAREAVSYTHLDVYKSQVPVPGGAFSPPPAGRADGAAGSGRAPVSAPVCLGQAVPAGIYAPPAGSLWGAAGRGCPAGTVIWDRI